MLGSPERGTMKVLRGFQFVNWFPHWQGLYFDHINTKGTDIPFIYDWFLGLGFWEIGKWHEFKEGDLE